MKLCERFLTSFEMTINVLCLSLGVGWRRSRQPTPNPYKKDVIICHSERSEESTVLYLATIIQNINYTPLYELNPPSIGNTTPVIKLAA